MLHNESGIDFGAAMREQHGSWLALVTYCAVTALAAALSLGVLFAGASVAVAGARSSPVSDERQAEAIAQLSQVSPHRQVEVVASQLSQPANMNMKKTDEGSEASSKIFAGMVTDSRCGARHPMNSDKTSAQCARSCVRDGSRYVLVDGEKKLVLEGNDIELEKLAGERVEVLGRLEGDAIRVSSVRTR
jgi:hypothetical protein